MFYLIIAQGARLGAIWATSYFAKQVFRSIVVIAVGCYLMQRVKRQNLIDERRGFSIDEKSSGART